MQDFVGGLVENGKGPAGEYFSGAVFSQPKPRISIFGTSIIPPLPYPIKVSNLMPLSSDLSMIRLTLRNSPADPALTECRGGARQCTLFQFIGLFVSVERGDIPQWPLSPVVIYLICLWTTSNFQDKIGSIKWRA